jgi:hypothetical protein
LKAEIYASWELFTRLHISKSTLERFKGKERRKMTPVAALKNRKIFD